MTYHLEFTVRALKDLRNLTPGVAKRITHKIESLRDNLQGDVKRLTDHRPRYRLRVGDWRVLFDIEGKRLIIYRVLHRRESY